MSQENAPLDILTLRKRASDITSGDIISFAQNKGYEEVIFNFCRFRIIRGGSEFAEALKNNDDNYTSDAQKARFRDLRNRFDEAKYRNETTIALENLRQASWEAIS